MSVIKTHSEIKTVILAARWGLYAQGTWYKSAKGKPSHVILEDVQKGYGLSSNVLLLQKGLTRTVKTILAMNRKVILLSDVPEIGYDVPRAYLYSVCFKTIFDLNTIRPGIKEYNERQKEANAILEALAELPGVTLIRPEQRMFDEHGKGRIIADNKPLYRDDSHLSTAGAIYLESVFDEVFKTMAKATASGSSLSLRALP